MTAKEFRASTLKLAAAGKLPVFSRMTPPAAAAGPAGPCAHLGRALTGPERQRHGKDHRRRWALCLHPEIPLGQFACGCKGCGPACPGYSPRPGPAG